MFDEFCRWALDRKLDLEEDDENEVPEASTYVPDAKPKAAKVKELEGSRDVTDQA